MISTRIAAVLSIVLGLIIGLSGCTSIPSPDSCSREWESYFSKVLLKPSEIRTEGTLAKVYPVSKEMEDGLCSAIIKGIYGRDFGPYKSVMMLSRMDVLSNSSFIANGHQLSSSVLIALLDLRCSDSDMMTPKELSVIRQIGESIVDNRLQWREFEDALVAGDGLTILCGIESNKEVPRPMSPSTRMLLCSLLRQGGGVAIPWEYKEMDTECFVRILYNGEVRWHIRVLPSVPIDLSKSLPSRWCREYKIIYIEGIVGPYDFEKPRVNFRLWARRSDCNSLMESLLQ